jgi:hypothetical protein
MAQIHRQPQNRRPGVSGGPGDPPARSRPGLAVGDASGSVSTHVVGQVVVLDAAGRLSDVVLGLAWAIRRALAEEPRGVVCDISGTWECGATGALRLLATAGAHSRYWPGIPVAVACRDPQVRETLRGKPLADHLIVSPSRRLALAAILRTRGPQVASLGMAPHPTAPRAASDFVSGFLQDLRLGPLTQTACLVASELVTNAVVHAGTDIELSVAVHHEALRLTVRDRCPTPPRRRAPSPGAHRHGLAIVAGLSTACGVLPTADGGKAVWVVLDPTSGQATGPATGAQLFPGQGAAQVPPSTQLFGPVRGTQEIAAVLRRTVRYAVARRQDAQAAQPMLLWVADHRRGPMAAALQSCRRDLAAVPTSIPLAREVDMLANAVDALPLV